MGIEFNNCVRCGESLCDCGDNYNYCYTCSRVLCNYCLVAPKAYDEETGEMLPECCPYCSNVEIHNDDLLSFLLQKLGISHGTAKEMYRNER